MQWFDLGSSYLYLRGLTVSGTFRRVSWQFENVPPHVSSPSPPRATLAFTDLLPLPLKQPTFEKNISLVHTEVRHDILSLLNQNSARPKVKRHIHEKYTHTRTLMMNASLAVLFRKPRHSWLRSRPLSFTARRIDPGCVPLRPHAPRTRALRGLARQLSDFLTAHRSLHRASPHLPPYLVLINSSFLTSFSFSQRPKRLSLSFQLLPLFSL